MDENEEEDPRAKREGICRATQITGQTEWICIKPVHAKIYHRKNGGIIYDNNKSADTHYMVNRWPNRPRDTE